MDKISVVIPTLWKGDKLKYLLPRLQKIDRIVEILIIDNDNPSKNIELSDYSKVNHLKMEKNIYVNPAWNLGTKRSKGDIVILIQDDYLLDPTFLEDIEIPENTIIGLSHLNYPPHEYGRSSVGWNPPIYEPKLSEVTFKERPFGFGTMMIYRKDSYIEIPDELKIWCGDDYLFYNFEKKLEIQGLPIEYSKLNLSASLDIFDSVKNNDWRIFVEKYSPTDYSHR